MILNGMSPAEVVTHTRETGKRSVTMGTAGPGLTLSSRIFGSVARDVGTCRTCSAARYAVTTTVGTRRTCGLINWRHRTVRDWLQSVFMLCLHVVRQPGFAFAGLLAVRTQEAVTVDGRHRNSQTSQWVVFSLDECGRWGITQRPQALWRNESRYTRSL